MQPRQLMGILATHYLRRQKYVLVAMYTRHIMEHIERHQFFTIVCFNILSSLRKAFNLMNQFKLTIQNILLVLLCVEFNFAYATEVPSTYPKQNVLSSDFFTPYIATYQVFHNNKYIGKAKLILEKVSTNKYRLTTNKLRSFFIFYNF